MSDLIDTVVKDIVERAPILVVGAGIGGLVAALDLARRGARVCLLERQSTPGGKARQVDGVDAGPTVFTMRWVFEEIAAAAGARLDELVELTPARVLARHAWSLDERLDLFADPAESEAAIARFAGPAEARGFAAFRRAARRCYDAVEGPFIKGPLPTMVSLAFAVRSPADLLAIKPFATLWSELCTHFRDPRLRQLFGRYATYCGSSPFLAPATLMLVADVEQQGVWYIEGGMAALARALAGLAERHGAEIRYDSEVAEITTERGRLTGVRLTTGETLPASSVVLNADPAALGAGLFGPSVRAAVAPPAPSNRSLSAITWTGLGRPAGFPLLHHNVFFSRDYQAEFEAIGRGDVPAEPTVYVCAQDRRDAPIARDGPERMLVLINAPANGDSKRYDEAEVERCRQRAWGLMQSCGLSLDETTLAPTSPASFDRMFPGMGGALYGPSVHGSMASFRRPGSRTAVRGLYLAGGATHPGAGVPMAALSGRLAASALTADLGSTWTSRTTAMPGGMSMR